jgi:hypothetical protein
MWTQFWDMCSGGGTKTDYSQIFIEADEDEAKQIFVECFGIDPENTTCDCCGPDFAIHSGTLEELTEYFCETKYYCEKQSVEEFLKRTDVCVIYADYWKESK